MELAIDLADRAAIRNTYRDCQKWRSKRGVLRPSTPPDFKPFDPAQLLPDSKWKTLLELGCGLEGWLKGVVRRASQNSTIYAYDISQDVLRFFSRDFKALDLTGKFDFHRIIGDGEHLPFVDNYFDAVSAVFVGHHMANAAEFVAGIARVLRPDGWFLTNSLDWNFPPPDFPSRALSNLLKVPADFVVRNAFDESSARRALTAHFRSVREHRVTVPATLRSTAQLTKLHSRLEEFIKPILPAGYSWVDYLSSVEEIIEDYLKQNDHYYLELPMTYFIAEGLRGV
jgi:SAM-dependent methyltransferase